MTYTEFIEKINKNFPHLKDKLKLTRLLYKKEDELACFYFESDILVEAKDFKKLKTFIQKESPRIKVELFISCPSLNNDFLANVKKYRNVLCDFIIRHYPRALTWIREMDWEIHGKKLLLTCPDEMSAKHFDNTNFKNKLSNAIKGIFCADLGVDILVASQKEEFLKKMQEIENSSLALKLSEEYVYKTIVKEETTQEQTIVEKQEKKDAPKQTRVVKQYVKDQELLYGKKIEGPISPISLCKDDTGLICVCGTITSVESRELKGGKTLLLSFNIGDQSGTVYAKAFIMYGRTSGKFNIEEAKKTKKEAIIEMAESLKPGTRLLVFGNCTYDSFIKEPCINVISMARMPQIKPKDNAQNKRVELHVHTQMSVMDATNSAKELIEHAANLGHSAIAITDYGVVQAYPEAFASAKKNNIKFIPGCELYVSDFASPVSNLKDEGLIKDIVVLDFETTGLNVKTDLIIEIGAAKLRDGMIVDTFQQLVNPAQILRPEITKITGIRDADLIGMPSPEKAVQDFLNWAGDCIFCAHNASFDMGILNSQLERMNIKLDVPVLDTLVLARAMYKDMKSYKLKSLCNKLNISLTNAHRAVHDATATAKCLAIMLKEMEENGITTLADIQSSYAKASYSRPIHITTLVQKQEGLKNLYYLISQGHLKYFKRTMQVPRFELNAHRQGLLLGTACNEGELFQAILSNAKDEELEKIASYYDFIEIMPVANNMEYIHDGYLQSIDELRDINKKIYNIGKKLGIPVVATGDVHYINKEDSIYRSIIQATMGRSNFDKQPDMHFRNTEEMLEEFSYLGSEESYEVVVTNSNKIADMIDKIRQYPVHPDGEKAVTFQPFWEDAADNIKNSTYERAHDYYGEELPEIVQKRIDKELNSILGYGFGTLYNIAQKLVLKSNSDGYVVGSRGSVGSSFVATMCGITEVNPLPPHYRCKHCHKGFFDDLPSDVPTGIDLPDKDCPICGRKLIKDGYNIPFEVFLGFKGDKVPDIDLNFSGEYQAKAHAYVEELFGKGYVFRAGTISAMQDKTAFGYVNKYLELKQSDATRAHKERLVQGLAGVKRTTGQHPGGMVVVPKQYSIYDFTPIQHPADDQNADTITTHFDFNSMHDILVKLDILGHDDPTMLHYLEELTGFSYLDIPLDDKKVMSLFLGTEALGVSKEDILSKTGTLGIPEFGTDFVQGMLEETKPKTMGELLRISGLSHGTDVWLGNAQDLIRNKIATLSECVCTRDDIMNALIGYGMDSKLSFDTMEAVRKGKGLKPEVEEEMRKHAVPQWYIDSCNKIKYMFPKAHASAYVIMAIRIAYYKVYYPLAYYCAYFSIRSKGYDASSMILSNEVLKSQIIAKQNSEVKLGVKEKDELYAMKMALEMQARGFKFLHPDIYKSDAEKFLIEDNCLRCPLTSLPGLGSTAALKIVEARNEGDFSSIDDLKKRAGIGNTIINLLKSNKAISGIPESAQLDLFSSLGLGDW